MSVARVLCAVASVSCFAVPLAAQVSLRVVDASGRPVPAVLVEVYGRGEVISVASTSTQGVAELSAERWDEARRLSLSHLAYQTLIVQVDEIPTDGVIRIEPEAIPIEALDVDVGQLCPVVDEPAARRLWSDVASLYATDTGSRATFAYLSLHRGSVREDELHRTSNVETVDLIMGGGWGTIHGGDHIPTNLDDRIEREGYAWPPLAIDGASTRENAWLYPELDRKGAHHFASRVFGALHDFAVKSASEERTTLVFCGNSGANEANINGTITLVPGRAFLEAEWRFATEDPNEGAGGSVTFTTFIGSADSRPHLVSSRGLFYRHAGVEPPYPDLLPRAYVREVTASIRWHLRPSSEQPCIGHFYQASPAPGNTAGVRFGACVAEHWGRE